MTDPRSAPEGWMLFERHDGHAANVGPFYRRAAGAGVGFFAEKRHLNLAGIVHGGMLLTLADNALFNICWVKIGAFRGVTLSLSTEFISPGREGTFIEASGEVLRAGRSVLFARGVVTSGEETLLNFSGAIKRVDQNRPPPADTVK